MRRISEESNNVSSGENSYRITFNHNKFYEILSRLGGDSLHPDPKDHEKTPPRHSEVRGALLYENAMEVISKKSFMRDEKNKLLEEASLQKCTFSPKICKKSVMMVEKDYKDIRKKTEEHYHRHKFNQEQRKMERDSLETIECSFTPKISNKSRALSAKRLKEDGCEHLPLWQREEYYSRKKEIEKAKCEESYLDTIMTPFSLNSTTIMLSTKKKNYESPSTSARKCEKESEKIVRKYENIRKANELKDALLNQNTKELRSLSSTHNIYCSTNPYWNLKKTGNLLEKIKNKFMYDKEVQKVLDMKPESPAKNGVTKFVLRDKKTTFLDFQKDNAPLTSCGNLKEEELAKREINVPGVETYDARYRLKEPLSSRPRDFEDYKKIREKIKERENAKSIEKNKDETQNGISHHQIT